MILQLNGEQVYYGTGSGHWKNEAKNIVFVHGAGFDHSIWVMPARYFARHGFNVIALDLPGHGQSSGVLLTSIDAMADWVAQVIIDFCDEHDLIFLTLEPQILRLDRPPGLCPISIFSSGREHSNFHNFILEAQNIHTHFQIRDTFIMIALISSLGHLL